MKEDRDDEIFAGTCPSTFFPLLLNSQIIKIRGSVNSMILTFQSTPSFKEGTLINNAEGAV